MDGPTFLAEYRTDCVACDEPLEPGQIGRMTYDGAAHDRCPRTPRSPRSACPRCFLVHAILQEDCDG